MNMGFHKNFLIALFFYAFAFYNTAKSDASQQMDRQAVRDYMDSQNRINYSGWKGIVFYSSALNGAQDSLRQIAERCQSNAKFIATLSGVGFISAESAVELYVVAKERGFLILTLEFAATKGSNPASINATIKAYTNYEANGKVSADENKPHLLPRKGELVFWERSVIGATTGEHKDLIDGVSNAADPLFKEFFSDFVKAQEKKHNGG